MFWMLTLAALATGPVDGNTGEWGLLAMPLVQVQGENSTFDGHAGARLSEEGLAIAVAVRDDMVRRGTQGDAIHVAFRFDAPEPDASMDARHLARTELRVALDRDAIRDVRTGEVVVGAEVAWLDTPGGYSLEARIPLAALPLTRSAWIYRADLQITAHDRDAGDRQAVYALSEAPWTPLSDITLLHVGDGLRRAMAGWWAPTGERELWRWTSDGWHPEPIPEVQTVFERQGVSVQQVPARLTGQGPGLVARIGEHTTAVVHLACDPTLSESLLGLMITEDCDEDGTPERQHKVGPDARFQRWAADGSCGGEACAERHLHLTTALRAALLLGDTSPWSADLPLEIACETRSEECFRERFTQAHLLRTFTDVVVINADGSLVRYARTRNFDEAGQPLFSDGKHLFRRAEMGRTSDAVALGELARLPSRTSHMELDLYEPSGDRVFEVVHGDRVSIAHPFERPPTVFCADGRVLRRPLGEPRLVAGTGGNGIGGTQIVVRSLYRLPCEARMVLGAGLDATFGERWIPAKHQRPTPVGWTDEGAAIYDRGGLRIISGSPLPQGGLPSYEPCTVDLGDQRIPLSSCSIPWVGDLNADGQPDAILEEHGEMGCGSRGLLISRPEGPHVEISSSSWEC